MSKRIFWFISIAISVAFVVWFYLGDGVAGLAKWEIKYRMYLIYIIVACVLQVLFALLSVFWAKKEPSFLKIFANVMATLLCVVFIGGIAVVNILGSLTPEADGKLNLLHSGETLPMKKSYTSGNGWEIVDIESGMFPEVIGREASNVWIMASNLIVKVGTSDPVTEPEQTPAGKRRGIK
jgi:hypothetical protein